jgi:DNA-binding NarL/FixJ family response regulator
MTISLVLMALTALGLSGALALFLSLKREFEARSRRESERVEAILARLEEADTQRAPAPIPTIEPDYVAPSPILNLTMLNLSKRVQVMRMLRQGEDTRSIAAALGLSRAEVQLLASVRTISGEEMSKAAGVE